MVENRPEYVEGVALEGGFLKELFSNCLFQPTEEPTKVDVTANFDPNNNRDTLYKCKTKESRAEAYKTLRMLCDASPAVLRSLIEEVSR